MTRSVGRGCRPPRRTRTSGVVLASVVMLAGVVGYFGGETSHSGLPTATELIVEQAWPGVDVVWSGTGGHIEATYRVAPGADPAQVRVAWQGAESVAVTAEGRLRVTTPVHS